MKTVRLCAVYNFVNHLWSHVQMVLLLKLLYFYCFTRLSRYNFLFRYYSRLFCIPMSVFYNMETFILPRGLLIMYSSSLSFQKTPIFHTGGYFLEFVLLLLLLITGFIYIYVNLRSTEKPRKMIKIKSKYFLFLLFI